MKQRRIKNQERFIAARRFGIQIRKSYKISINYNKRPKQTALAQFARSVLAYACECIAFLLRGSQLIPSTPTCLFRPFIVIYSYLVAFPDLHAI